MNTENNLWHKIFLVHHIDLDQEYCLHHHTDIDTKTKIYLQKVFFLSQYQSRYEG